MEVEGGDGGGAGRAPVRLGKIEWMGLRGENRVRFFA